MARGAPEHQSQQGEQQDDTGVDNTACGYRLGGSNPRPNVSDRSSNRRPSRGVVSAAANAWALE